jgi:hypothetical protein
MEGSSTSDMSVYFYQITRHNKPEDTHVYTHRRENLKSHFVLMSLQPLYTVWRVISSSGQPVFEQDSKRELINTPKDPLFQQELESNLNHEVKKRAGGIGLAVEGTANATLLAAHLETIL